MADELRDLVLRLSADSRRLVAELRNVEGVNKRTTKRMQSDWEKMSRSISGAFSKLGGLPGISTIIGTGFSVSGIASLVTDAQDAASALDEVSKRLGISARALQEYEFAAKQAGISDKSFTLSLSRFSAILGETALGAGKASGAFKQLGISVRDSVTGEVRDVGVVFEEVIGKLAEIESAAERNAFARKFFGKSGPLIAQLSGQLQQLIIRSRELGVAWDDNVIRVLEQTQDQSDELSAVLKQRLSASLAVVGQFAFGAKKEFVELVETLNALSKRVGLLDWLQKFVPPETIQDVQTLDARIEDVHKRLEAANAEYRDWIENSGINKQAMEAAAPYELKAIRELEKEYGALVSQRERLNRLSEKPGPLNLPDDALDSGKDKARARAAAAAAKEAAREIEEAQRRVNSAIEASFSPAEKLLASLDEIGADYKAGKISLEQYTAAQESVVRQFEEIDQKIQDTALREVESIIQAGLTPAEKLVQQLDQIGEYYREGAIDAERFALAQESIESQLKDIEIEDLKKGLTDLEKVGEGVFEGLTGALSDFILSGKGDFASLAQSFASEFLQLGIKGFFGGTLGSIPGLEGIFGGGKASGGPISAGKAYLVGERGPELIVPRNPGYVVPNMSGRGSSVSPAGSASGTPVYVTVNNNNSKANVETRQNVSPSGRRELEIIVTEVIARDIGRGGSVGRAIDGRLGVRPKGV